MKKKIDSYEDTQRRVLSDAHNSFEKGLNSYAFFKTNNHALSDDLVQDTFIKTWAYMVRNGKVNSMKSFLHHILRHLIIDEYRKHKATSLDVLLEKGFEPETTDHERIFDVLDGERALLLIKLLPVAYQKVVHMRYVQDLSLQEISSITGQSKNTVAVRTHRGLEKLKVLYNNQ